MTANEENKMETMDEMLSNYIRKLIKEDEIDRGQVIDELIKIRKKALANEIREEAKNKSLFEKTSAETLSIFDDE